VPLRLVLPQAASMSNAKPDSAVSSSAVDVVIPVAVSDSHSLSSISIPPTVSGPGGSSFELPASSTAGSFALLDRSGIYRFTDHEVVDWAKRYFLSIEITECRITLTQLRGISTTSSAPAWLQNYKYGIVPDGTPTVDSSGASLVHETPRLVHYSLNLYGSSSTTLYGPGGLPFPPGVQLDLKPVQFRTNYPVAFVGAITPIPTSKKVDSSGKESLVYDVANIKDVFQMQIDFKVRCSAPGFGVPV